MLLLTAMETYVLTATTYQRQALFVATKHAGLLVKTLLLYRDQGWFQLHGFSVMPDQLHVLLTPGPDQTIESCAHCIKSGFAQEMEALFRGNVWQVGIEKRRIHDAADFRRQLGEIEASVGKRNFSDRSFVHTRFACRMDPMPCGFERQVGAPVPGVKPGWNPPRW